MAVGEVMCTDNSTLYYNYNEALDRIEYFMKKTKIRKYCTKICKGYCCNGCYESEHACHLHEGRRLACSYFLCTMLKSLLFNEAENKLYTQLRLAINTSLSTTTRYRNIYFKPYTPEQINNFRVSKILMDKFFYEMIDIKKISATMAKLIKYKFKISDPLSNLV